jgi:hypothetical protein
VNVPVSYATMRAEDTLVRLERFKSACQSRGWSGPTELTANLGRSASFWSDLWHGRKSFGEKLARDIEEKMGLPRNALDLVQQGHPRSFADLNGFEGQLVTLFRQLDHDEQHDALRKLSEELLRRRLTLPETKN